MTQRQHTTIIGDVNIDDRLYTKDGMLLLEAIPWFDRNGKKINLKDKFEWIKLSTDRLRYDDARTSMYFVLACTEYGIFWYDDIDNAMKQIVGTFDDGEYITEISYYLGGSGKRLVGGYVDSILNQKEDQSLLTLNDDNMLSSVGEVVTTYTEDADSRPFPTFIPCITNKGNIVVMRCRYGRPVNMTDTPETTPWFNPSIDDHYGRIGSWLEFPTLNGVQRKIYIYQGLTNPRGIHIGLADINHAVVISDDPSGTYGLKLYIIPFWYISDKNFNEWLKPDDTTTKTYGEWRRYPESAQSNGSTINLDNEIEEYIKNGYVENTMKGGYGKEMSLSPEETAMTVVNVRMNSTMPIIVSFVTQTKTYMWLSCVRSLSSTNVYTANFYTVDPRSTSLFKAPYGINTHVRYHEDLTYVADKYSPGISVYKSDPSVIATVLTMECELNADYCSSSAEDINTINARLQTEISNGGYYTYVYPSAYLPERTDIFGNYSTSPLLVQVGRLLLYILVDKNAVISANTGITFKDTYLTSGSNLQTYSSRVFNSSGQLINNVLKVHMLTLPDEFAEAHLISFNYDIILLETETENITMRLVTTATNGVALDNQHIQRASRILGSTLQSTHTVAYNEYGVVKISDINAVIPYSVVINGGIISDNIIYNAREIKDLKNRIDTLEETIKDILNRLPST